MSDWEQFESDTENAPISQKIEELKERKRKQEDNAKAIEKLEADLVAEFPEEFLIETYDDELEVKDEADWQLNWNSRFEYISFNPSRGHNSEYAPLLAQMFLNESDNK